MTNQDGDIIVTNNSIAMSDRQINNLMENSEFVPAANFGPGDTLERGFVGTLFGMRIIRTNNLNDYHEEVIKTELKDENDNSKELIINIYKKDE